MTSLFLNKEPKQIKSINNIKNEKKTSLFLNREHKQRKRINTKFKKKILYFKQRI